jgi:tRNA U34 5-methylaminomethyl-2-thiouridine-forming methyltransferase MnmC
VSENKPFITADGSTTLCSDKFGVHYHSTHGAITESRHIFIDAGLLAVAKGNIKILEIGLGTGLNAALTADYANENKIKVTYKALELYPITQFEHSLLNYNETLPPQTANMWDRICRAAWNDRVEISPFFSIRKLEQDFTTWRPKEKFDLIYFDAFAPDNQPEMWQAEQFAKLYKSLNPGGILVTYSVKGTVKNALKEAGFSIERLPGPPGKRHMLRAIHE